MTEEPTADPFDRVVATGQELIAAAHDRRNRINGSAIMLINQWRPIIGNAIQNANQKLRPAGLIFTGAKPNVSGDQSASILVTSKSSITEKPFPSLKFTIDDEGSIKAAISGAGFGGFPVTLKADAAQSGEIVSVLADYAEKCLIHANSRS